jgi:hypothetical protein
LLATPDLAGRSEISPPPEKYQKAAGPEGIQNMAAWLRTNRALLDRAEGLGDYEGPAILTALTEMEADKGCVEGLGAVNRWLGAQIGTPGRLPARLQDIFALRRADGP